jgi:uroporphyrinogen-III synthase
VTLTPRIRSLEIEAQALAISRQRAARPGHRPPPVSLDGCRVLTLESRRAPELALLIVNYGGQPLIAPALREEPLEENQEAFAFAADLVRGTYRLLVLTTGIGTRLLIKLATPLFGHDRVVSALASTPILARGPKPVAALREVGVTPWLTAPSPNTWREMIDVLDSRATGSLEPGVRVAVQEYGAPNPELVQALLQRGADVKTVSMYRWSLPEDVAPLRAAVRAIVSGGIDVMILTASVQLVHLLEVASAMGLGHEVRRTLRSVVIASIGPMTSDEVRRQGLSVDIEPTRPKMGVLVKELADRCRDLVGAKRASAALSIP